MRPCPKSGKLLAGQVHARLLDRYISNDEGDVGGEVVEVWANLGLGQCAAAIFPERIGLLTSRWEAGDANYMSAGGGNLVEEDLEVCPILVCYEPPLDLECPYTAIDGAVVALDVDRPSGHPPARGRTVNSRVVNSVVGKLRSDGH